MVRTSVLHVITGLETGGAEASLCKLLSRLDRSSYSCEVLSLTNLGPMAQRIAALGVGVAALGMSRRIPNPFDLIRLATVFRRKRPAIVHAWMYDANILTALAGFLAGRPKVVWEIRHANLDPMKNKRRTICMMKAGAVMSGWAPASVVYNSETARRVHRRSGYGGRGEVVIPNGFDTDAFRPLDDGVAAVRKSCGIPEGAVVVGHVGRYHRQKDHATFVRAAAEILAQRDNAFFVCCGDGVTFDNSELAAHIDACGLRHRCRLLGKCADLAGIVPSFDVYVSSSLGESFSNSLGEAMACGVPCVVTDVGDSAGIVGETGKVVRAGNPTALAEAVVDLLRMEKGQRDVLGAAARRRVMDCYSLDTMVARYEALYAEVLRP